MNPRVILKPLPGSVLIFTLLMMLSTAVHAAVQPNALFGDNAVLQQSKDVPVWGTGRDGEVVTVEIQSRKKSTVVRGGRWMVRFQKLESGGPFTMTISGDNILKFKNIMVGDVWLCSGQSNMELGLGAAHNAKDELPQANHPDLRLFVVDLSAAFKPQEVLTPNPSNELHGHWEVCTSDTVLKDGTSPTSPGFSAVAYFFGREIQATIRQPVGLIGSYYGGTMVEAWTSLEALKKNPAFKDRVAIYESALAKASGKESSIVPAKNTPSVLFNAMIHPLIPYAIKGVIWYQGEQNAASPEGYGEAFKCLITDWRKRWALGDFPFLFVQIAAYKTPQSQPSEGGWAWLREQQLMALSLPKTAMASAVDLGAPFDVHPRDKLDVGHRLALAAKHVAYGQDLVFSGPIYETMKIKGGKIRIYFRHADGGLKMGVPPWTPDGISPPQPTHLTGFAIADKNRNWFWADAVIEGAAVVVSSTQVMYPTAVRYGWASFPIGNLYNSAGLPASPFRTDDWQE